MFRLEKKKKKILILLSLNKENLTTKLSAILAPYNIKSNEFLKQFVLELKKLYYDWVGAELDLFLNDNSLVVSNIELMLPVEVFLGINSVYTLNIKLPNWGYLFSYSLFFKRKLFYLYIFKGLLIKHVTYNMISNYFLLRCSFFKSFILIY